MSKEYQNILENAMALPQNEFFALVQALLAKVQEQISIEPEWDESEELKQELEARIKAVRDGETTPIPGNEVMARLKKRFS